MLSHLGCTKGMKKYAVCNLLVIDSVDRVQKTCEMHSALHSKESIDQPISAAGRWSGFSVFSFLLNESS